MFLFAVKIHCMGMGRPFSSVLERQKRFQQRKKIEKLIQFGKSEPKTNAERQRTFRERLQRKITQDDDLHTARKMINAERAKRYRDNVKMKKFSPLLTYNDVLPSTSNTITDKPKMKHQNVKTNAPKILDELETQYIVIKDTIRKILSQEKNNANDETEDEAISTLDKFKSRLIGDIAKRRSESQDEDEMWLQLHEEYGCDCQLLWDQMRVLTIKKLKRLLSIGDRFERLAPIGQMTSIDWMTFDMVLVHEDVDVIGEGLKPTGERENDVLKILFELVQKYGIEDPTQTFLRERWQRLTQEYNTCGRYCSSVLLQKRWYQLKELTTIRFYQCWQPSESEKGVRRNATQLMVDIAARYNTLMTQTFPEWKELQEYVTLNEEMTNYFGTNINDKVMENGVTSTLDKFKSRLIREIAKRRYEGQDEYVIWFQLKEEYVCDCQSLWRQMKFSTIDKLTKLVSVADRVENLAPIAQMTSIDWMTFDLVLVHEDVDVIGGDLKLAHERENGVLKILFQLVQKYGIEDLPQTFLRERWQRLTEEYNTCGRYCSSVLLQKRWYQLKALTRKRFFQYWQPSKPGQGVKRKLTKLVLDIAARYNTLMPQPAPESDELQKQYVPINEEKTSFFGTNINDKDYNPDLTDVIPKIETDFVDLNNDGTMKIVDSLNNNPTFQNTEDKEITIVKNEILDYISKSNESYNIANAKYVMIPKENDIIAKCGQNKKTFVSSTDSLMPKIVNVMGNVTLPELNSESYVNIGEEKACNKCHIDESSTKLNVVPMETEDVNTFQNRGNLLIERKIISDSAIDKNKQSSKKKLQNMQIHDRQINNKSKKIVIIRLRNRPSSKKIVYDSKQLSKNPDFHIRLKHLSAQFLSSKRNRRLFNMCKPLTVDVYRTKMLDDMLHLKYIEKDITKCIIYTSPNSSTTRVQSTGVENQKVTYPAKEILPPYTVKDNSVNSRLHSAREINDLENIRITNKNLLVVEVGPIQRKMDETNQPPVKLINPCNITDQSNATTITSSTDSLNTTADPNKKDKTKLNCTNAIKKTKEYCKGTVNLNLAKGEINYTKSKQKERSQKNNKLDSTDGIIIENAASLHDKNRNNKQDQKQNGSKEAGIKYNEKKHRCKSTKSSSK